MRLQEEIMPAPRVAPWRVIENEGSFSLLEESLERDNDVIT